VADTRPLLLLLTDYRGLIPQRIMAWDGLDLEIIRAGVEGAGIAVQVAGAHEIDLRAICGMGRVGVLYASSQEPRYKQYLQGIAAELSEGGCVLYPRLAHLLAHEDKAYQAQRVARVGLEAPRTWVFGDREHAFAFLASARYPLVGKAPSGFGSSGVRLLRSEREARCFVQDLMVHRSLAKGRPLWKRAWQRLCKPSFSLGLVILQELVPGLAGDWKVLVWGDAICGVFRDNRAKDFRASGSGRLRFLEIPTQVLDFAHRAVVALELPWASLDIGFDGVRCHLLEYQGLHFGLTTSERATFHYVRDQTGWRRLDGKLPLEEKIAEIVVNDFRSRGWVGGGREAT
jgi:glutathione synthase/RimK-type ligase-like ATP-grasp enzyme